MVCVCVFVCEEKKDMNLEGKVVRGQSICRGEMEENDVTTIHLCEILENDD